VFAPKVATRRAGRTIPPISGEAADAELALRRQLSRLQRQLADAQRELANKDEELAAEVERRLEVTTAAEALQREHDELEKRLPELEEYRARTEGLDQRLQDAVAAADELTHQLERERAERQTIGKQLEEQTASFERARALWKDETTLVAEQHAAELEKLDSTKRVAIELVETQMAAALDRQREKHDAELAESKAAHERSVAALRGELEPKVAVARNLSEEIERLTSQLSAARAEHARDVSERVELHNWEMQQQAETHNAQLATEVRHHQQELAKRDEDIEAKAAAIAQAERNAQLREESLEQTVSALRDSQKKLQQELAEAKEKAVQSDASKWAVEQRLTGTVSQIDKLTAELRDLQARFEALEIEARNAGLDRQRFAAYLEEGLAMLGAIPPKTD
jgi:chromosome segregation ATPase